MTVWFTGRTCPSKLGLHRLRDQLHAVHGAERRDVLIPGRAIRSADDDDLIAQR
jgi:hypothetical protein